MKVQNGLDLVVAMTILLMKLFLDLSPSALAPCCHFGVEFVQNIDLETPWNSTATRQIKQVRQVRFAVIN